MAIKAVKLAELEHVILDTTAQEKAVAFFTDSRLLEVARAKIVRLAQRAGLKLKQTFEREGQSLRRRAGRHAHARQFKRPRTVLGRVLGDVQRRLPQLALEAQKAMTPWLERAERLSSQAREDKNKLYALHASEVERIFKGKARQPYEFGMKFSVAVIVRHGLRVEFLRRLTA